MAEGLKITNAGDRASAYEQLIPQVEALVADEDDLVANMANIAAALKAAFGFWWVGFYLVRGAQLVLGPFQGPVACTRIDRGKGVCGSAWERGESIIVPDVDAFPGHIACSTASRSEIVVPIVRSNGEILGVLDVDSDRLSDFSELDSTNLSIICSLLAESVER
jgi:GAF domain-containing protein